MPQNSIKMKNILKSCLPHVIAIIIFLLLTVTYFSPAILENKDIVQGDVTSVQGWGKDIKDHFTETGEFAHWSNSMFSGMPANMVFNPGSFNLFHYLSKILTAHLPGYLGIVFLYLLGFYIFFLSLGCKPWLSIIGAIGYAFASYNFIIIEAGHGNKSLAMATMAPIIAGVILCFRKKYIIGMLTTLLFTGVHIYYNHQQITYYLLLILILLAIVYFIYAIKEKQIKGFLISCCVLIIVASLSVAPSVARFLPVMDYTKETMRGGAVLQNNPDGQKESSGLDVEYAFQWSYGKVETMTLLLPNFYGGVSKPFDKNSETYKELMKNYRLGTVSEQEINQYYRHTVQYWGDQPFTSGPVYAGAIICFLFILGLMVVKGPEKWWLLAATILSILLSWGRNFAAFNEFLFYHLPLYNKFRAPSMALVIAGVTMTTLAILAVKEILEHKNEKDFKEKYLQPLYISGGITAGLCLLFALLGGVLLSFTTDISADLPAWLNDALQSDRKSLLTADAWRSFAFIALAFAAIWAFLKYKMKTVYFLSCLGVLILVDLWGIDKRYINDDSFVPKKKAKAILPTEIDKYILLDTDPNYRVLNLTTSTFNDSQTSYFHKSVGGYSPAKLRRYQDIIDYHFSKGITMGVLNMLNARYVIVSTPQGPMPQRNPDAMGNCWFVDTIRWVTGPDEEITALYDFDPHTTAVVDVEWKDQYDFSTLSTEDDDSATITLTDYKNPGHLFYESNSATPKLAVFSEVFYKTWKVYIDGKETPLIRANYILRALPVPEGKHEIEFKCYDDLFQKSAKISLWGSIFVGLCIVALMALLVVPAKKKVIVDESKK